MEKTIVITGGSDGLGKSLAEFLSPNNNVLKVANYNVSGGFYIGNENTEYLDRAAVDSIDNKMLEQIINIINTEEFDVICFQEIITTESIGYIKKIADNTNLKFYDFYELSECNIIKDTNCGIAIFSKYPIKSIKKDLFPNPRLSKTTSSGNTYYTYDKGYMIIEIQNDIIGKINLLTHHGFPYRRFNSTPNDNMKVFNFFDNIIKQYNVDIITGDFNAENFIDLMKNTSDKYKRTIDRVTTVDGKCFDDILVFRNVDFKSEIIELLSDHFMVVTEIYYK